MRMISTPYYLIDKARLLRNMETIAAVREKSGAKALLALKCFATWSVFDLMRDYMDGTTSSSLYEVRLGREKFGGETHAYSVAYADEEIDEVASHADKIIFNSIGQLERFENRAGGIARGLRLNPGVSSSSFDLADPARPFSRLGEWDAAKVEKVMDRIGGFMIHNNCENADFSLFDRMLSQIEEKFGASEACGLGEPGRRHPFTGETIRSMPSASASRRFPAASACRSIWSRARPRSPEARRWKSPCSTRSPTASNWPSWTPPSRPTCWTC